MSDRMRPQERAERIQELRVEEWRIRWRIYDECAALKAECEDDTEFRALCREYLETSHQNVNRWAARSVEVPPEQRHEVYAPRTHHTWRKKGVL